MNRLEAIRERAYRGPTIHSVLPEAASFNNVLRSESADLIAWIAQARSDVPLLLAAVEAAKAFHVFSGHVWVEDQNRAEFARLGQALAAALAPLLETEG